MLLLPDHPGASCQPTHAPGKYKYSSQGWMASNSSLAHSWVPLRPGLDGRHVPVGGELPSCRCGGRAPKLLQENAAGSVKAAGN